MAGSCVTTFQSKHAQPITCTACWLKARSLKNTPQGCEAAATPVGCAQLSCMAVATAHMQPARHVQWATCNSNHHNKFATHACKQQHRSREEQSKCVSTQVAATTAPQTWHQASSSKFQTQQSQAQSNQVNPRPNANPSITRRQVVQLPPSAAVNSKSPH